MTLSDYGIYIKASGKTICPQCGPTRKNKSDKSLSVAIGPCMGAHGPIEAGDAVWNCHNCGHTGSLKPHRASDKKKYEKPPEWVNATALSDDLVKWFGGRKISQSTLIKMKIGERMEWMPGPNKETNCVLFPYFRNNECVNIKFRDGFKHFKMFKGAELIFYNMNFLPCENPRVMIVEGEIDVLSWVECGVDYVISVPNGATKGNQRMEYLDNCFEFFSSFTEIIIATDDDEPGILLRNELARRLGIERCSYIEFGKHKDSNGYLMAEGQTGLLDLLNNKKEFPLKGIIYVKDISSDIRDLYHNGFPNLRGMDISEIDKHMKIEDGSLIIVTGIPNHGKSEYIDFILARIMTLFDVRSGIFSPENFPIKYHFSKFAEKIIGKRFNGPGQMSEEEMIMAENWMQDHVYFVRPDDDDFTIDNILEKARILVLKYGIKNFVIDPYNRLEHMLEKGESETNYISKLLDKIVNFKQKYGVNIFLIAHPTKIKKNKSGQFEVANLYDIAGSANFFNKADIGISVYRKFFIGKDGEMTSTTEVHWQKIRFKHWGTMGMAEFHWNAMNGRYIDDNSNWLLPPEEQKKQVQQEVINFYEVDHGSQDEPPF